MREDWPAVARELNSRSRELGLRQRELAVKARVSPAIVRELQQNKVQRRRNPRTLEALSVALERHPQHLSALLVGRKPPEVDEPEIPAEDPVLIALNMILREIRGLRAQVGTLTNRIGSSGGNGRSHGTR